MLASTEIITYTWDTTGCKGIVTYEIRKNDPISGEIKASGQVVLSKDCENPIIPLNIKLSRGTYFIIYKSKTDQKTNVGQRLQS